MEKPIGAPARGRRAWQRLHLAGRSGGAAPCQSHLEQGRSREREKYGTGYWSHALGAVTHRGLAIMYPAGKRGA